MKTIKHIVFAIYLVIAFGLLAYGVYYRALRKFGPQKSAPDKIGINGLDWGNQKPINFVIDTTPVFLWNPNLPNSPGIFTSTGMGAIVPYKPEFIGPLPTVERSENVRRDYLRGALRPIHPYQP